jgi:hypothetical protein
MRVVQVLLFGLPAMDAELVRRLLGAEDDMKVVAEIADPDLVPEAVELLRPQVVVAADQGAGRGPFWAGLMRRHPGLAVVLIDERQRLTVHELRLYVEVVGEAWPVGLVTTIRSTASHAAAANGDA